MTVDVLTPAPGENPLVAERPDGLMVARHPAGRVRATVRRVPRWGVLLLLVLLLVSAAFSAHATDSDSGYDLMGVLRAITLDAAHLRWQFVAIVAVLGAAHYLATAISARVVAGTPVRLGETVLVQLAAAAANRLTPAGVGGSVVTGRFFVRRGASVPGAVGALLALKLVSAIADIAVLAAIIVAGGVFGLAGGRAELSALSSKLSTLVSPLVSWWTWIAVGLVIAVLIVARRYFAHRGTEAMTRLREPLVGLCRRPAALATLLASAGCTTLVLALAFVAATAMVPGPQPHLAVGGLMAGFMLGSAASSAVPTPAGVGATETALSVVLIAGGVPSAHAVEVVLIYRVITFWLPALFGLLASRQLRRVGAL
jgi:uncharacterized membrane protein YbhN (UPF0104 family)